MPPSSDDYTEDPLVEKPAAALLDELGWATVNAFHEDFGEEGRLAEGLPLANVLIEELQNFRAKITAESGHVSFEQWRERDHDDVVLALALACWKPENTTRAEVIFA